jgi:hypothetical protein
MTIPELTRRAICNQFAKGKSKKTFTVFPSRFASQYHDVVG